MTQLGILKVFREEGHLNGGIEGQEAPLQLLFAYFRRNNAGGVVIFYKSEFC